MIRQTLNVLGRSKILTLYQGPKLLFTAFLQPFTTYLRILMFQSISCLQDDGQTVGFQSIIWLSDDGQTAVKELERSANNNRYRVSLIYNNLDYIIINGFDYVEMRTRWLLRIQVALVQFKILSDPTMRIYAMVLNIIFCSESKHTARQ